MGCARMLPSRDMRRVVSHPSPNWGRQEEGRNAGPAVPQRDWGRMGARREGGSGGQSSEPERRREDGQRTRCCRSGGSWRPAQRSALAGPCGRSRQPRWAQGDGAGAQWGSAAFSSLTGFGDIKEDQYKPFEVRLSSCLPAKTKGCESPPG